MKRNRVKLSFCSNQTHEPPYSKVCEFESHPLHSNVHPLPFNQDEFNDYLLGNIRAVTAKNYVNHVNRLGKIANLGQTEKVKSIIYTYQSKESYKELLADAYDYYVKFKELS